MKFPAKRFRGSDDLLHLKARQELTDEFKSKMLHDDPVRIYRLSEGDIAAARRAKGK